MADDKTMAQATQIWSMLDDMAENNPSAYRKFIDKQLKEGKELNAPPKPHMCVQTCIASNWIPVFINFCSWARITKPKDDSAPIPVFGSKLMEKTNHEDGDHFVIHVAFHPEVLDQFGKSCKSKEEQDALVQLAIAYIEDNNKTKLSPHYHLQQYEFFGDTGNIREDFGLAKDPMNDELKKLAKSFGPLANIATKDPELIDKMTSGDTRTSEGDLVNEEVVNDIGVPGVTLSKNYGTRLIEEVKITPDYEISYQHIGEDNSERVLVVKINLDQVDNVHQCTLDITQNSLDLEALEYSLNLQLPEIVNEDKVKARFSKTKHQLAVTLPIQGA